MRITPNDIAVLVVYALAAVLLTALFAIEYDHNCGGWLHNACL